MNKIDTTLKMVWLIIGIIILVWLSFDRIPTEWNNWKYRFGWVQRSPRARPETGVIVGEQAAHDQAAGIRRQGLRFGQVLDPTQPHRMKSDNSQLPSPDDWLLVMVNLARYRKPLQVAYLSIPNAREAYTWKAVGSIGGYRRIESRAINIVFYRRDGSADRLLLEQPAWIHAIHLPKTPGELFYYEIAIHDTNGDDRIDENDGLTLWSSDADGNNLKSVWMPHGEVKPTGYLEPLSGDLFGAIVQDTDHDGSLTSYDQPRLFRIALGDTTASQVVSDSMLSTIRQIVFGTPPDYGSGGNESPEDGEHVSE